MKFNKKILNLLREKLILERENKIFHVEETPSLSQKEKERCYNEINNLTEKIISIDEKLTKN